MIKKIRNIIFGLIVYVIFFKKTIYYVTGMRRSGNHAFIRWLKNALEEQGTSFIQIEGYQHLYISETQKTFFLDEVNELKWRAYFSYLYHNYSKIRKSQFIILSTEDCGPDYQNWRIPRYDYAIYVERTLLNVIASRLRKLEIRAAKGHVWAGFNISDSLFKKMESWLHPPEEFYIWKYDKWLISRQYRTDFLNFLNLSVDIHPSLSTAGSSFTGSNQMPNHEEALNRYKMIEFSETIINLLLKYKSLLSQSELEFLKGKYQVDIQDNSKEIKML